MFVEDDPQTAGRARLPRDTPADVRRFVETLARFERGDVSADDWRAFRLGAGVDGPAAVLRVGVPRTGLNHDQARAIADVADRHGLRRAQFTTRQNVQIDLRDAHGVEAAMERLRAAALDSPALHAACDDADSSRPPSSRPGEVPPVEAIAAMAGMAVDADGQGGGPGAERTQWLASNVRPQAEAGHSIVTVTLPLGDVTAGQLRALAALADAFGDGHVRATADQNAMLRWVKSGQLPALYRRLAAAGLGAPGAGTIEDVTSCPGAESCRLAVTHSRAAARAICEHLANAPRLARAAHDLRVRISGCANGCGHHRLAGIGLQGSMRDVGDRLAPHYLLTIGGTSADGGSAARAAGTIPARRVADAVDRLVRFYERERQPRESAAAFFSRVDAATAHAAIADLEALSRETAGPDDFVDPGDDGALARDGGWDV